MIKNGRIERFSSKSSCLAAALVLLLVCVGCKPDQKVIGKPAQSIEISQSTELQNEEASKPVQSDLGSREILAKLNERYSQAKSYQDKAVLYLSYRLNGQSMQEPQPWAIQWDSLGRLSAKLFNSRIQGDGELLSCYIYDIDSGNMDNQHLLVPYQQQLPMGELFRDPIAKHFVGGYSELPIEEVDLSSPPMLIPPTLAMLSSELEFPWIESPEKSQRLADTTLDDKSCFVVRTLAKGMTADLYIDQADFSLIQASLPLKMLAGKVITSNEVVDVELLAKFHEAIIDGQISDDSFGIETRPESTPVRRFVSLPDAFPSELIGETAPDFQLTIPNGRSRTRIYFDGKVSAFLWLAGTSSYSAVDKLAEIAKEFPSDSFHVAAVYSDSELEDPSEPTQVANDVLWSKLRGAGIPFYYDRELGASSRLKVTAVPSVIVLDGESRIQFSKALSEKNWAEELKAVLQRVADGDDVASEMKQEYQRFLDSYHQQLLTVSALGLLPEGSIPATSVSAANSIRKSVVRLQPKMAWASTEFKQPGNILFQAADSTNRPDRYGIFDGWRSIVELDSFGKATDRKTLKLPAEVAVSSIRVGTLNSDSQYAVFGPLAKQVYLFDAQWQPTGTYPEKSEHDGILDCRFSDLDSDGTSELVVAFKGKGGVHLVDTQTFEGKPISTLQSKSLAMLAGDVVVSDAGVIGRLKAGDANREESELSFQRIVSIDNELCGLGVTNNGQWTAVGFNKNLERTWALNIGSQFFECEIEPVAACRTPTGEVLWAIADTENVIHLVSGTGKWLGDFQSKKKLTGVCLSNANNQIQLIVSDSKGVEAWNLNLESE